MTAQVVDSAGLTQTGNIRRSNEDSFLLRSPLFMVADGMGGALAGELASRMCAEAFAELDLIQHQGEEALRATIAVANRRIYERSRTDAETSGMGTTVTAALVARERHRGVRPRRRQPRVSPARRRPAAPFRGSLARARARPPGAALRGRGGAASPAERDHARPRHRRGGADRHVHARGAAGRRAAPVHRRPEHHDLRARHRRGHGVADGCSRHRPPARPGGAEGGRRGQRDRGRRALRGAGRRRRRGGDVRRDGPSSPPAGHRRGAAAALALGRPPDRGAGSERR